MAHLLPVEKRSMTAFSIFIHEQIMVYIAFVYRYRLGDAESPDEGSGDDLSTSSTPGGPHNQHGHSVTMGIYKGGVCADLCI